MGLCLDSEPPSRFKSIKCFLLRNIIFLICFLFLSSCSKNKVKILSKRDDRFSIVDPDLLVQAKYSDLSVPVGYKLVPVKLTSITLNVSSEPFEQDITELGEAYNESNSVISDYKLDQLHFVGGMDIASVVDFYRKRMELSGWQIVDFSSEKEGTLYCKKLKKSCVVSIRELDKRLKKKNRKTEVLLFIRNKIEQDNKFKVVDINSKRIA